MTLFPLDYKKILAGSKVYDIKNAHYNRIQRCDIDELVRLMFVANRLTLAEKFKDGYKGAPVPASYVMYIHPALIEDFIAVHGWIGIKMYRRREQALPNEIGSIGNLRIFIDSSLEDYVINDMYKDNDEYTQTQFIAIVQGFSDNTFAVEDYIVVKTS